MRLPVTREAAVEPSWLVLFVGVLSHGAERKTGSRKKEAME
jgi:hypothetical protein